MSVFSFNLERGQKNPNNIYSEYGLYAYKILILVACMQSYILQQNINFLIRTWNLTTRPSVSGNPRELLVRIQTQDVWVYVMSTVYNSKPPHH